MKVKKVPRGGGAPIVIADSASVPLAWLDVGTILYGDGSDGLRAAALDGGKPRRC